MSTITSSPQLLKNKVLHKFGTIREVYSANTQVHPTTLLPSSDPSAKVPLFSLSQQHSNIVIEVDEHNSQEEIRAKHADALITRRKGVAISIYTADCVPILISNKEKTIIAAVHSGWRGAFNGIISNTIDAIRKYNIAPDELVAAIGPSIQQESYEVSDEFHSSALLIDPASRHFFRKYRNNHHFDLPRYCAHKLFAYGIPKENVDHIAIDTYNNHSFYNSHRRNTKMKLASSGRQYSIILM